MAEWLGSPALLRRARVLLVPILSGDVAPLISHVEVASHMPQLEGPTTRICNYVLGGFGEKKQGKKRRLAQVPIFFFFKDFIFPFSPKAPRYIVVYF